MERFIFLPQGPVFCPLMSTHQMDSVVCERYEWVKVVGGPIGDFGGVIPVHLAQSTIIEHWVIAIRMRAGTGFRFTVGTALRTRFVALSPSFQPGPIHFEYKITTSAPHHS